MSRTNLLPAPSARDDSADCLSALSSARNAGDEGNQLGTGSAEPSRYRRFVGMPLLVPLISRRFEAAIPRSSPGSLLGIQSFRLHV